MNRPVQLDDVDRALIRELIADGRATYAKLAPTVGLSQAAVRTRVQRLIDEHYIIVTGRVDPASLGLGTFGFAFLEVDEAVEKVAAGVADIDDAVFVAVTAGRYDLMVEFRSADTDGMLDVFDSLRTTAGVGRLQAAWAVHYDKQDWSGVGDRSAVRRPPRAVPAATELDEIDRKLLAELMADGRATYASLAPVVGLSQAAVRERVLDMIATNVVAIEAHPIPEAIGIEGYAAVALKADGPVRPVVEAMCELAETTLVARTLGRFDVAAEVWFDDNDHLMDVLDGLRSLPGVAALETVPYLRIAKEQFGSVQGSWSGGPWSER